MNNKVSILHEYQKILNSTNKLAKEAEPSRNSIKPTIFTNFGYIIGDVVIETSDKTFSGTGLNNVFIDAAIEMSGFREIAALDFITIKDAYLYPYNHSFPTKIDAINIFADQITGFSFGSFTPPDQ